jgi:molybdopterin/thiamine biosynthesis adenylyltransferase
MNNLKLKSVVFDKEDDLTLIGKSNGDVLAYEDPDNLLIHIAKFLDGNHTLQELQQNLEEIGFNQSIDGLESIISKVFIEEKLVFNPGDHYILSDREVLKYDRILHFFSSFDNVDFLKAQQMQQKLFKANILVLGVGGTGGHTAHSLIASGIRNMTIVDFDNIEITNVTRQMLYDESDLGSPKIEIAKQRLLKLNPEANIKIISKKIENTNDILNIIGKEQFDFVVNTMDNPRGKIRYIVDKALYDTNIPYIFNGSTGSKVVIGPTIQKEKTKSYSQLVPCSNIDDIVASINDEIYVTNVIEPMNGAVGQLTAYEVIKYITKCADLATWGERVKLDMDLLEVNKYGY